MRATPTGNKRCFATSIFGPFGFIKPSETAKLSVVSYASEVHRHEGQQIRAPK